MAPYPEIIPACNVQAIDCSGGAPACSLRSCKALLSNLLAAILHRVDDPPRQVLRCTAVLSATGFQ